MKQNAIYTFLNNLKRLSTAEGRCMKACSYIRIYQYIVQWAIPLNTRTPPADDMYVLAKLYSRTPGHISFNCLNPLDAR